MSISLHLKLVILIIFQSYLGFVTGIEIKTVQIPNYGVRGEMLTLTCEFLFQDSEKLLFLKWYKEENEIFRYVPSAPTQKIMSFPQDGVNVDLSQSSPNKVILRNASFSTSGNYKCEGMVETTFQTATAKGYVVIIAPPSAKPVISGPYPRVSVGDKILGNCTLYGTKPAAMLTLYINNVPLQQNEVMEYTPVTRSDGLEDSNLGFSFIAQPFHFIRGILSLRCTATIGNLYWVSQLNVTDYTNSAQLVGGNQTNHDKANSAGHYYKKLFQPDIKIFITIIITIVKFFSSC